MDELSTWEAWYTRQLERYPNLTKEEVQELLLIVCHKKLGWEEAREKIITSNLKLARTFASRYIRRLRVQDTATFQDLIQAGNRGVMDAVDKYDPEEYGDQRSSTYAAHHINNRIWQFIGTSTLVYVPVYIRTKLNAIRRAREQCIQANHRLPTHSELAGILNTSIDEINDLLSLPLDPIEPESRNHDHGGSFTIEDLASFDETDPWCHQQAIDVIHQIMRPFDDETRWFVAEYKERKDRNEAAQFRCEHGIKYHHNALDRYKRLIRRMHKELAERGITSVDAIL
jgi:RNA polymerase primary sigma factor